MDKEIMGDVVKNIGEKLSKLIEGCSNADINGTKMNIRSYMLKHFNLIFSCLGYDNNYIEHIFFEIKINGDTATFFPKNLFTGLCYRNIINPESINADEYEDEMGTYVYTKKNGFCFIPKAKIEEINIKMNIDNG